MTKWHKIITRGKIKIELRKREVEAEVNSRESQSAAKVLQHEIVGITVGQGHDWLNSHDPINSSNTARNIKVMSNRY